MFRIRTVLVKSLSFIQCQCRWLVQPESHDKNSKMEIFRAMNWAARWVFYLWNSIIFFVSSVSFIFKYTIASFNIFACTAFLSIWFFGDSALLISKFYFACQALFSPCRVFLKLIFSTDGNTKSNANMLREPKKDVCEVSISILSISKIK